MILLDEKQQDKINKLKTICEKIEGDLGITVTPNEPTEIQHLIERLRPYLANAPKMLSDVSELLDFAKGECAEKMLSEGKILNAKSNIQKMWIEGKMNKYNKLFVRVESVTKKLDKSIDTLVSLLSFEKEKVKYNIHQK